MTIIPRLVYGREFCEEASRGWESHVRGHSRMRCLFCELVIDLGEQKVLEVHWSTFFRLRFPGLVELLTELVQA